MGTLLDAYMGKKRNEEQRTANKTGGSLVDSYRKNEENRQIIADHHSNPVSQYYANKDYNTLYRLSEENSRASDKLDRFQQRMGAGAYLTQEDLQQYQAAVLDYIRTGSDIRNTVKELGYETDMSSDDEWQRTIAELSTSVGKTFDLYEKYETEDAWNEMQAGVKEYVESLDYDVNAGKELLQELLDIQSGTYAADKDAIHGYEMNPELSQFSEHQIRAMRDSTMALEDRYGFSNAADLNQRISYLERYIEQAEHNQAVKAVEDMAQAIEGFSQKSRYDASKYQAPTRDEIAEMQTDGVYGELDPYTLYAAINGDEDAAQIIFNKSIRAGATDQGVGDLLRSLMESKSEIRELTQDEVAVYNALEAEYGIEKANEYYNLIQSDLYARDRQRMREYSIKYAQEHPHLADLSTIAMAPIKGLSYIGQAVDLVDDGKIDENSPYNVFSYVPSDIRGERGKQISEKWASALGDGWGKVGNFDYQLVMSMGDFLMTTAVTGGNEALALGIMGSGAAADTTIAAKQRGLDDSQAFALGTIAGAAEVISEKIGWDALFDAALKNKSAVKYFLKASFSESLEEPTSSIINTMADIAISGDKAEIRKMVQDYVDEGKDLDVAWGLALASYAGSLGVDAIGGFLSGAAMAGGSIAPGIAIGGVSNVINQRNAYKQYGSKVIDAGNLEALTVLGSEIGGDSITKAIRNVKKNASAINVGKLYQSVLDKVAADGRTELKAALEAAGFSRKNANRAAEVLTKYATRANLSDAELDLIDSIRHDQRIADAYKAVFEDENSVTVQRLNALDAAQIKSAPAVNAPSADTKATEKPAETAIEADEGTFLKSSGEAVSTVSISKISGKNVTVTVNGSTETSLDDISWNRESTALAYQAVTETPGMTPAAANMILSNPKASSAQFLRQALDSFKAGIQGTDIQTRDTDVISSDEAQALYAEGRKTIKAKEDAIFNVYKRAKGVLAKTGKKATGKLRVAEGVDTEGFNDQQAASAALAAKLAPALTVDIVLYEDSNPAKFGYYKHSEDAVYINVNARWGGNSMMTFTLAHELVHRAKAGSIRKYNAFANYLIKEYTKAGISVDDLVAEQMRAAERAGVPMTKDEAFDEVVCDAAQRMFTDTYAGRKLANWGALRPENWNSVTQIRELLTELMDRLRTLFKDADNDSDSGRAFRKLDRNVQRILADMLVDMSKDAAEKLGTIKAAGMLDKINTTGMDVSQGFLGSKDISYNLAAAESHKAQLSEEFSKNSVVPLDTLMQRYDKILRIWKAVGINLNSKFLNEWNSKVGTDQEFSVFKAQSGYKYNIELSTMCKKGVALFEAIDTIVRNEIMKELDTKVLGKAEKEILYDILKSKGFEIPCAICYVEQARQREGVIIDAFLNGNNSGKLGWNSVLDSIEAEMAALGMDFAFPQVSREIASEKYTPANLDMDQATQDVFFGALMTVANKEIERYNRESKKNRPIIKAATRAGIQAALKGNVPANLKIFKVLAEYPSARFRIEGDLLYSSMTTRNLAGAHQQLYSLFNSQGGVSGYKTKQTPVVYWGDLLKKTWRPSNLRKGGGIRNQSNSDSQMYTLLDQVQMYIDLTAKGYYLQAYTKVVSELKLLGLSRAKINASLIPKVVVYYNNDGTVDVARTKENAGLDENGNPIFDDFEGINSAEAFMLIADPEYSKSIGGVCIGYSDKHIWKLLDDPRVQMIIGFHDKTNDPNKRYRGARYAKNYNGLNEAKTLKADGKYETVHVGFSSFLQQAEKMFHFDKATETYEGMVTYNGKEYHADDIPKLAADLYLEKYDTQTNKPAYEAFKSHPNYYKLLADFSLYDSQGHYAPMRKVAYNMPATVPYLDANGNKQTMPTQDYIQAELEKEMATRDDLALQLADESDQGIIPQFRKAISQAPTTDNPDIRYKVSAGGDSQKNNFVDSSGSSEDNGVTNNSMRSDRSDNRGIREGASENAEGREPYYRGADPANGSKSHQGKERGNKSPKVYEKARQTVESAVFNSPNSEEIYYYLLDILGINDNEMTAELYDEAVSKLSEEIYNDAITLNSVLFENRWSIMGGDISSLRSRLLENNSDSDGNQLTAGQQPGSNVTETPESVSKQDDKVLLVPATSAIKAKAEETAQIYGNDDVATVPFMDRQYVVQRKSDGTYSVGVIGKGIGGFIPNDMSEDGFSSFADASEYAIRWILANDNEFKTKWRKTYAELTTNKNPTDNPDIRYKVSSGDVNTGDYATDNKLAVREDTSAPALLRKVDASTVTPAQRYDLNQYMAQLAKVDEQVEIRKKQRKELKAAEGTEKIKLQRELRKTENRIKILETQLKRIEDATPMQELLAKERAAAEVRHKEDVARVLAEMREEYGTIPAGENAVRDDPLPVSMDGVRKVSRSARTVKGAAVTPDEFASEIDTQVAEGKLSYIPITNDDTAAKASAWVENLGWIAAVSTWISDVQKGKSGADMAARGAVLLNNAAQAGNKDAWLEILHNFQNLSTNTAQGLQAMRILKQLEPTDALWMAKRTVKQMVSDMNLKGDIEIDQELLDAYLVADTDAERDSVMGQIQQNVADQIKSTFVDKFTAMRYLNMLGNLRTQIRNLGGNTAMAILSEARNVASVVLQQAVYLASGKNYKKNRSVFVSKALLNQTSADYKNVEALLLSGGRYSKETAASNEFARKVNEKRRVFRKDWLFRTDALEKYRKLTNWATERGDLLFSRTAFALAEARFLKARGITDISKADPAVLDEARIFAVAEAQEQTFRDTNWLSGWVSRAMRTPGTPAAIRALGEGIMPFRKTPANILVRSVEYSPAGVLVSAFNTAHKLLGSTRLAEHDGFVGQFAESGQNITGDQLINSWAKSLTGSGLFLLGMAFHALGWVTAGEDDDRNKENLDKLYGHQNFAIQIGDVSLTIDWLSPAAIPFLMGAQLNKLRMQDGIQLKDLESVITSIGEPLIEMSMLQGLSSALESVQYAEDSLGQMIVSFCLSYLTQGLSNSFLGQIERTFEDGRETTYVDKDSAIPGWLQREIGKFGNKIPFWDPYQIPYINAWGEEEENPNVFLNAMQNILSPSYIGIAEKDAVYDELVRLNEAQDDKNVIPKTPSMTYKDPDDDEAVKRNLTAEEYVALAKAQGTTQRKLVEKMISNPTYKRMNDTDKAKAIAFAYTYAREKAQIDVLGRKEFSAKWMSAIGGGDPVYAILSHVNEY